MFDGSRGVSSSLLARDPLVRTGPTLRWAFIGASPVARKVAADLRSLPDAELVAVATSRDLSARGFAEDFSVPFWASGAGAVDEVVARDDVDIVYVATPHDLHFGNAMTAISHGKHVLCEKPFTTNALEAEALVAQARRADVFLMEAMWTRFLPTFRSAMAAVNSGRLGEPRRVVADIGFPVPFDATSRLWNLEQAGGALLEMGVYPLAWATSVFGFDNSLEVRGSIATTGVDTETVVRASYGEDRWADLSASFRAYPPSQATIVGSRGWLRIGEPIHSPAGFTVKLSSGETWQESAPVVGFGYTHELREVTVNVQAGNNESAVLPLGETIATMRLLDRIRIELGLHYPADAT